MHAPGKTKAGYFNTIQVILTISLGGLGTWDQVYNANCTPPVPMDILLTVLLYFPQIKITDLTRN